MSKGLKNHKIFLDDSVYSNENPSEQNLDLYLPSSNRDYDEGTKTPTILIIYVHGGAWRSGDKANGFSMGLIENLSIEFPEAALSSINYRLSRASESKPIRHPTHNSDAVQAIEHLLNTPAINQVRSVYLIGHSVGAFISLSISNILGPSPIGGPRLDAKIKIAGLILVDGIYGLADLLTEYPIYKDFVDLAMGEKDSDREFLREVSPLYWNVRSSSEEKKTPLQTEILIIHSKQDNLLTTKQSELIYAHLKKLRAVERLEVDFDSVAGDHDELLKSSDLAKRIKSFILSD
ncbi:Alpha/Beta hydrolase protein [Phakopsora pachyrhizi]|uniref:Alpha/Beta hydrolase protein n=1 Tax=Phakopsora pachyrhizi TaxID=170000 RepID=A0AAV0BJ68_PHAPC|nr:Alpha/Beta hydrolase protein [Phakopsora pachyrhizi]